MTREEAIKRLKSDIYEYADFTENPNENEFWTAFDMAIKALEAPPNDNWEGYSKRLWKSAYERGKADAEQRWIPVSERLPEDMQRVLIWFEYYRYGDFNCMYQTYGFGYVYDGKWSHFINGETGWENARIIAWMPLPEPYKAESEVQDEDSD